MQGSAKNDQHFIHRNRIKVIANICFIGPHLLEDIGVGNSVDCILYTDMMAEGIQIIKYIIILGIRQCDSFFVA